MLKPIDDSDFNPKHDKPESSMAMFIRIALWVSTLFSTGLLIGWLFLR